MGPTPDERTGEAIANAIESALYMTGHEDVSTEEDARGDVSVFRVEIPWHHGETWYAIITKEVEQ